MEIDFQALVAGEKVHSVAEVVLCNHDKVTSGVVQLLLEEISYRALPEALVDKAEVDLDGIKVGDSILVKDLAMAKNPGLKLLTDPEAVVGVWSQRLAQLRRIPMRKRRLPSNPMSRSAGGTVTAGQQASRREPAALLFYIYGNNSAS